MQRGISSVVVLSWLLLAVPATEGQEKEALFLPQDAQLIDGRSVRGTTEYPLQRGLSRMEFPDSDTTFYVINEVEALRGRLSEQLSDIWRNGSDISIRYDIYRTEVVHLRLRSETIDARYFGFERSLPLQLYEYFDTGGYANRDGSIEFLEYQILVEECPELSAAVGDLESALQEAVGSIGSLSDSVSEVQSGVFVADGIGYEIRSRMGGSLEGRFSVSENSGRQLFDPAHAIMLSTRQCSNELEPELRQHDF